jgi:uncharacterized protein (TIGR00725 family)
MTGKMQIMVFGGHSFKPGGAEYEETVRLGLLLAEAGFEVASGGYGGAMEAVLKGAREGGATGVGYTVKMFPSPPNRFVGREVRSADIFERIDTMIHDCAGFVVLRGGTGTLCELAVCWEFINKKFVPYKPIVCYGEFWRPVVDILRVEPSVENVRTLRPEAKSAADYIHFAADPEAVVNKLREEMGRQQ